MAHKHRNELGPGDDGFWPLTNAQRLAHADALRREHAGHRCVEEASSLCQAGDFYAMAGDHDRAEQAYREAIDIEAAEPGAPQAAYAAFLLDHGRTDEALAVIDAARRLRPQAAEVFTTIGEALAEHDRPQQAARWFTAGLVARLGQLTDLQGDDLRLDAEVAFLAGGRYRARQDLGLPSDHIDALVQEFQQT
ncbi:hypothetical protein [Dactylosporangium sp. CA-092794]|uniref:hypothetical protein n=1 Tax=Dactylosporangium sp. CA-092794 TaxID=3239929 RepID=UPI003D91753D